MQAVQYLLAEELQQFLLEHPKATIIDVREKNEIDIVSLKGISYQHMPLSESTRWISKVKPSKDAPVVCLCHHGVRSLMVAEYLGKLDRQRYLFICICIVRESWRWELFVV